MRNLILLLVDASGSMAALERRQAAKGAICSLLEDSYQRRDVVALIAFRGEAAEELLPPTRSAVFAYRHLAQLPTGGRTPLAEGLKRARLVIERQARKGERTRPFLRSWLMVAPPCRKPERLKGRVIREWVAAEHQPGVTATY